MNEELQQRIARLSTAQRKLLEQKIHSKTQYLSDNNRILPSKSGNLPASFSQQRLWFLSLLEPDNWIYNRPANIYLDGELSISVLERCLNEIIRRHQVLRSNFISVDGQPTIVVRPEIQLNLAITDLSDRSLVDRDRHLQKLLRQSAQHQFDLAKDCLFTAGLVKLAVDEYILLLTFHHSIFDAWSMDVLLDEMTRLYDAYSQDKISPLPDLEIQYSDFANWQIQQLNHLDYQLKLDYWKQQLGGELPILALPIDRPRPAVQTFNGSTYTHTLSSDLTQSLKQLSQNQNVTLFMTLLAAYQVLLYRYSGQTDIIVGTPIAGRDRLETENLIGVFINFLALRTDLSENFSFSGFLTRVRQVFLAAHEHREISFERLVEELKPERSLTYPPIFQTLFQLRNTAKIWKTDREIKLIELKADLDIVGFDLYLDIAETTAGLACHFQYNTDLFAMSTIEKMAGHFETLLKSVVSNPAISIANIPFLVASESKADDKGKIQNQLSMFLIGEGSLVIQCAKILLNRGHQILGIIAPDRSIGDWAKEQDITYIQAPDNFLTFLSQQPFDYLFSIANKFVLPREILDLPRLGTINYHDAPLPRYAGTKATSWALIHREKTHGITWHRTIDTIDGGDIVKQVCFDIAKGETVFTLNSKCYEAAIHSFAELIDELATGKAVAIPQNLNERTYFPISQRLSAGGLLSFNRCAYELDAMVRAVNFGLYPNALGVAKLAVGSDLIVVSKLDVLSDLSQLLPGTIVAIEPEFLKISTSSYEIALRQIQTLDGRSISISDLVKTFGLAVGHRFPEIALDLVARIEQCDRSIVKHEAFWVERLADLQPLMMPYARRSRLSTKQQQYVFVNMPVPDEAIAFLQECRPSWDAADFLFAAVVGYLARIAGSDCFDLGLRDPELERELVGISNFFADCVPCHLEVDFQQSFEAIFESVRSQVAVTRQQKTYLRDIVGRYPVLRSLPELGSEQIFSVAIERVEKLADRQACLGRDLTLIISADGTECGWFYNAETLDGESITKAIEQFTIFLHGIVTDVSQQLAYLPLLTEGERHKILVEWNNTAIDYPHDKCIHQLFEQQVVKTPEAVAVVFEGRQLTYSELNTQANQLAHYLQTLGVKPETLVGICVERSLEMVVGLLGILKAGGAYVPLDPSYPIERLSYILAEVDVDILITQQIFLAMLPPAPTRVICLDADWDKISSFSRSNLERKVKSDNLAYIIYTSGSTGKPKGVQICHRAVTNFLNAMQRKPGLTERDILLSVTTISFDIAVLELYLPLIVGARIVLASREITIDGVRLWQLLAKSHATVMQATPTTWRLLLAAGWSGKSQLKILCGGEALSTDLASQLVARSESVWNLYGPTEGTVWAMISRVEERYLLEDLQATTISIGRPIANTQLYILDKYLQPVPIGVAGELYIGGAGLAKGYLNRPDLTAEKFILNPFDRSKSVRLYKTGDLARYLADGNIEFLGRIDNQVKVRGFRIELSEIECVLSQHCDISNAVAIVREDIPGDKRLVAYVVLQAQATLTQGEIRQFLQQKLPDYMVPSALVILAKFPLTPNDKIDRRALPIPDRLRLESELEFVPPRNELDRKLIEIWSELLRIEEIGIQSNFFELGGHSLLAMQVMSRIYTAFGLELPLSNLFEYPTIAQLSDRLREFSSAVTIEPIVAIPKQPHYPLSFAQQRLWFLDRLEGESNATYNVLLVLRLAGNLNHSALIQALQTILDRHQSLATSFSNNNGDPVQIISSNLPLDLEIVDLTSLPAAEREERVINLCQQEARRPFNLAISPLFRIKLFKLANASHVLCLTTHHIITDGWSMGILKTELSILYQDAIVGRTPSLKPLPIRYIDFAQWQRNWLQGAVLDRQVNYWKNKLANIPPLLSLPTDRARPPIQTFVGKKYQFQLTTTLTHQLTKLSDRSGVTLFMTLLAAFSILLSRYTQQTDIVIGSPIANRNRQEIEPVIGFFANTLPLRIDLDGHPSFEELLTKVREVCLDAYNHQDLPFEKLVDELQPERSLSYHPIFQTMFSLHNTPTTAIELTDLTITPVNIDPQTAKFDLTLALFDTPDGLVGTWQYNTDLFDASSIERMAGHFEILLAGIVTDPDTSIDRLPLLTAAERHQILVEWNTPVTEDRYQKCVHQLFAEQVARTPEQIAVVCEGQELTYRELNARANQLAHYLQSLGVGANKLVGIAIERSLEMVVGILGVLKAGGAYVPIDPAYPTERLAVMMADANVSILLTQSQWVSQLPTHQALVICLDLDWEQIALADRENPSGASTGENLAYVIYTSGSTGKPKGVMISHRALSCFVRSAIATYEITAIDRILQFASINFDAAVEEIYPCLLTGSTLVLRSDAMLTDAQTFFQACEKLDISVLSLPTAFWHQLTTESSERSISVPTSLRLAIVGGEKILPAAVKNWQAYIAQQGKSDRLHLLNTYGPTEATVVATSYRIPPLAEDLVGEVPIGRPFDRVRTYILSGNVADRDRHQLQPVPIGAIGELYIGGDCLALGYLNYPELTSEKFIPDPFVGEASLKENLRAGARLYKTGDLARYRADGNIEYLGRIDNQVKLRGFRIELGEVETILTQHPAVANAVAIVREDVLGDRRLIAYVVPQTPGTLTQSELRQFLQQKLPTHTIPSAVMFLDRFPLTPNGKIDRRALPIPDRNRIGDTNFVAPRTEVECQLAQIWSKLLQLDAIGIQANFFELGGHSLLAMQVVSRIQTVFGLELPLRNLFEYPTIAQLSDRLREFSSAVTIEPIVAIPKQPHYPLSFAQQRLWFLDRLEGESNATYNVLLVLRLAGNLNHSALIQALQTILDRHQSLATSFSNNNGDPVQIISSNLPLDLEIVNLTSLPAAEREERVINLCQQEARRPFNLAISPLFRIKLFKLANASHVLCLTTHHIITDGWSMGILKTELSILYQDAIVGRTPSLKPLPIRYIDFAQWQRNWLQGAVLDRQVNYWKNKLANIPPLLSLPTDRARPPIQTFVGKKYQFQLTTALTHQLTKLSDRSGVTLFMTLLAAFSILLSRYTQQTDIVIGSPIANRSRQEIEPVIGFFANTLPLRIDLDLEPSFQELLTKVREVCLDAYNHQDLPFEKLVDELQPERSLSYHPIFQTIFSLHNPPTTAIELTDLTITPVNIDPQTAKFDLTLALFETPDGLVGNWEYNTDLFDDRTIERMAGHFQTLLTGIVANSHQQISRLPLLPEPERQQLLWDWNDTHAKYPHNICIHQLFEQQVAKNPDAVAVVFDDSRSEPLNRQQLTYGELNAQANQLAHYLQALGVKAEVLVGICVERSLEMVVGLLAILKAGGAYVPLDPSYPTERLNYMLADAGVEILLTNQKMLSALPLSAPQVVCLDADWETIDSYDRANLTTAVSADNLVYVIYTSGSTGQPKGVEIEHQGLVNLVVWHQTTFGVTAGDIATQLAGIAFDAAAWELWVYLTAGASLHLLPDPEMLLQPQVLQAWFRAQKITIAFLPTQLLENFLALDWSDPGDLKTILTGGDKLRQCPSPALPFAVVNNYGPTENTVVTTSSTILPTDRSNLLPLIGKPIANTQVYILDRQMQPVPIGVAGQLYIGGDGLARGYLNRTELTAEKFIPNPFSPNKSTRLYQTGDLVRYLADGNIEFLGRIDNQVKIRGFRIELGEIESVLSQHPDISNAVAIVREDDLGDKQLVAYCVGKTAPLINELRDFIAQKLPNYMVPSAFVLIDSLPLTPNGKIDRRVLPTPDRNAFTGENVSYSPPKTPLEQQLATIWSKLLKLERVGIHDNFFELGGHSLLAIKLVMEIATTLDLEISLQQLWQTPTIAELAASVADRPIGLTAIPRRTADRPLPLSFAQQRLWFLERLDPNAGAYHIPVLVKLTGPLDLVALQQALDAIVAHHEVLRTNFSGSGDLLLQVIRPPRSVELLVLDFQALPAADLDSAIELRLQQEILRAFNLERDLMLRGCVVQISPQEQIFLATIHHIAADGWSMGIFATQLASLYQAYCDDRSPKLPVLPIQYADFALWQRQWLQGDVLDSHLAYWQQQLADAPPVISLPIDRPRPAIQTFNGGSVSFTVDRALTRSLTRLSRQAGVTLFMTLLAAFDILLYRYTGSEDLIVGVPVANRERREIAESIGCFVNTLVLRGDLSDNPSFDELLERIERMAVGAYSHQDLPFDVLVEELQPQRDLSYSPIFQVLFGFEEDIESRQIQLANLISSPYTLPRQTAKFDLSLSLEKQGDSLRGTFTYNTDLFAAETIERMSGHFQTLFAGIVANPHQQIASLPLLTAAEQQQLWDWNQTQTAYPQACIHQLFEEQTAKNPDAIAVVFEDLQLTYRELNDRSNQLAHHLQNLGVKPEILVGIYVERSLEMVVGLLGILKAGGAYVPLDPSYPAERLSYMVADAGIEILLTQQDLLSSLPSVATRVICLDADWRIIDRQDTANLPQQVTPANLAYTIYTSGSTGKPKGVQICHRSVTNFLHSMRHQPGLTASDILLSVTTISFDIAVLELYLPLIVGAKIVLASRETVRDGSRLFQLLTESQATVMQATPTTWQLLLAAGWCGKSQLKILCGGEALSPDLASQLVTKGESVWNLYGPTEATVWATIDRVDDLNPAAVSIGRAIANVQTYILDPNLQPVPIGIPGELYIGGDCLARDYLNRPDLTAQKFIANPFSSEPQARLYKTGDLVKHLPNGKIEYLSRLDDLVKLRGVRIELGEIESLLATHPAIRSTVAIVREDTPGDKRLVAYIIPDRQQSPPPIRDLHDFLAQKLPRQSLPSAWVMLESFPLTPNGKIDRRALPLPELSANIHDPADRIAPRNSIEVQLVAIWTKVLGIAELSIHDNFFDLGGHSLLAVNIFTEIERIWEKNIPLSALFQYQTIAELATKIASETENADRVEIQSLAWKSLIKIKQGSSNLPPLFFIHDVSGSILFYRQIVECMRTDRTCYVLQPLGMDGRTPPIESISEMAANYIAEILQVQPEGAYHLSGYSFGSFVALEIARQLHLQGREVGLLAIIDTSAPRLLGSVDREILERPTKSHQNYSRLTKFLSLNPHERIEYIRNGLRIHRTLGKLRIPYRFYLRYIKRSLSEVGNLDVYRTNDRALYSYLVPSTDPSRVTLFYSDDKLPKLAVNPALNWDKIATGGVELYAIPGSNHATIIQMPYVKLLGEKLTSALDPQ